MSIPTQNSNNAQNWTNQAFASLFDSITSKLPNLTFWAIIFAYIATAGLNCWAIHLPIYLSVPLSLAIQSLRFLYVFTPFLNPSGRASHLPEIIAIGASLLSLFELSFSLQALGEVDANFWSLFLFGAAILVLSMVLELQFISAGKKAFGLTAQKVSGGGAVSNQVQQLATPTPIAAAPVPNVDVQALEDENKFLRDQVAQMQLGNGTETWQAKKVDTTGIVERAFIEWKRERERSLGEKPFISTHSINLSDRQSFQRRRFYKKRLWSAKQKEIACLRSGKPVSKKIKKAIVNNSDWVTFYDVAIKNVQKPALEVA